MSKAYVITWDNGLSYDEHYVSTCGVTLSEDVAKREVARLIEEFKAGHARYELLNAEKRSRALTAGEWQELQGPLSRHIEDEYRDHDDDCGYDYDEFDVIE